MLRSLHRLAVTSSIEPSNLIQRSNEAGTAADVRRLTPAALSQHTIANDGVSVIAEAPKSSTSCSKHVRELTPIALLALLGAALRGIGLFTDLQLDEVWSITNAAAASSWLDILRLKIDNNHHLTSMYMHTLGPDAAATLYRLPSYAWGVATIPLAWLIGLRDSRTTATVNAVLFAFSAALIFYSSEARGYTAVIGLTLAAWYFLERYVDDPRPPWLVGFALSSIAGVMSHQTFILFYAGAFIWCDAHLQRRYRLRVATRLTLRAFALPTVAIGLFAIVSLVGQQIGGGPPFEVPTVIAQTLTAMVGGPQHGPGLWILGAVVAGLTGAAVWSAYRAGDDRWRLYVAAGVIAPALIVFLRRPPTLAPRYFLVPAAVFLLAVARLLAKAIEDGGPKQAFAQMVIAAQVIGGVSFSFSPDVSRGGYQAALTRVVHGSTGVVSVASSNRFGGSDWRTDMMIRYYRRALGVEHRLRYLPVDQARIAAPDWVIDESPDSTLATESLVDSLGHTYTLDSDYPAGSLSGITWRLYRRHDSKALAP